MHLRRNVLIFHQGALGDFVLSWPLAMALGRLYPQSRVIYVTQAQKGALAEEALRVDSADIEGGWHGLYAEGVALPKPALRLLTGAHAIFSFVASPGDEWSNQVAHRADKADLHLLAPRPPEGYAGHATDYLLEQLAPQYAFHAGVKQMLNLLRERGLGSAAASKGGPIAIHPGSGSPTKCWPLEKYKELARNLLSSGRAVKFIAGEVEEETWPAKELKALESEFELHRPTTYLELLKHLRSAGGFVGNDSGPGHLAGMFGLPTLSLFGPTSAETWKPIGPRVKTLGHRPLEELQVADVLKSVEEMIKAPVGAGVQV